MENSALRSLGGQRRVITLNEVDTAVSRMDVIASENGRMRMGDYAKMECRVHRFLEKTFFLALSYMYQAGAYIPKYLFPWMHFTRETCHFNSSSFFFFSLLAFVMCISLLLLLFFPTDVRSRGESDGDSE